MIEITHDYKLITVRVPEGWAVPYGTLTHAVSWLCAKSGIDQLGNVQVTEHQFPMVAIGSINCDLDGKAKAVAAQMLNDALVITGDVKKLEERHV